MKKDILWLFTSTYPYGNDEPFIENELSVLSKHFDGINIIPEKVNDSNHIKNVPENVKIINIEEIKSEKVFGIKQFLQFLSVFLCELVRSADRKYYLKKRFFINSLAILKNAFLLSFKIDNIINNYKNNEIYFFYTYWFTEYQTLPLCILKHQNKINNVFTRVNGYDIYDERSEKGFFPFRYFQMKMISKIFCVSNAGKKYLSEMHYKYKNKLLLSYFGVFDYGINPGVRNANQLVLVSCSNVIELKRIHLIIEILKQITINVKWIHIGTGPLLNELKKKLNSLPDNVNAQMLGYVPSVYEFYGNNHIDFFLTTSETEGLPVSIIEAISFGIPVIATDVGGISEIVNEKTGQLIQKKFNPIEVANMFNQERFEYMCTSKFRGDIKNYWLENFYAEKNFTNFARQLKHS